MTTLPQHNHDSNQPGRMSGHPVKWIDRDIVRRDQASGRTSIRVVSLWQPWATLLVAGFKKIETRSWATPHRGLLLVHAAKPWTDQQVDTCQDELVMRALAELGYGPPMACMMRSSLKPWDTLPRGEIVGQVNLARVAPTEELVNRLEPLEHVFGDFRPERYGWVCEKPVMYPAPIPMPGEQGIFFLKNDYAQAVDRQRFVSDPNYGQQSGGKDAGVEQTGG